MTMALLSPISALEQFPESKLLLMVSRGPSLLMGIVNMFLGPRKVGSMQFIIKQLSFNSKDINKESTHFRLLCLFEKKGVI
jgi:hypothetical protein